MTRGIRRGLVGVLLAALAAVLVTMLGSGPASAQGFLMHNILTGSDPAQGAVLAQAPAKVSFNFNAPIQTSSYDTITVDGPNATHWATSNLAVYGDNISASLGSLGPAGSYVLGYKIVSADGHPVSGEVTITLTKPGTGTPLTSSASGAGQSGSSNGGVPAWLWLVVAVVVVAAIVAFVRRRSRTGAAR
ncbi:MAG TPA: copper resistance CopC family protein [Pseudonocardiaceae bacterium]|nr:copper resistance CopC family protein [Pseudonocardiaceae bacterium]